MPSIRTAIAATAACVALFTVGHANAAPVSFDVKSSAFVRGAGYGVDADEGAGAADLLDVAFAANGLSRLFSLDVGEAFTFDFGTITLQETGLIRPGETDNLGVAAIFNFSDPTNGLHAVIASGTATLGLVGDTDIDFTIDWDPLLVSFGNGGQFRITMDTLNFRLSDTTHTQTATVRLLANSVPEPTSWLLVGLGLAGLAVAGRTRRGTPG